MKHLALTLSLILGLGTSVNAKDIRMTCDLYGIGEHKILFEYQDRLFGDKVVGRHKGKWIHACDAIDKSVGQTELSKREVTIEEKALVCLHRYNEKDDFGLETTSWVIDFETRTWSRYRDGQLGSSYPAKSNGDCN